MTRPAFLVSVSVRMLAAAAALLALAALLASCANTAEEIAPATTASTAPAESTSPIATPTPVTGTPFPVPSGWSTYTDPELRYSMPVPGGLHSDQQLIDLPKRDGLPATQLRVISFDRPDNIPVVGISFTPNPTKLSLEEWIRMRPGWPCDPSSSPTCTPEQLTIGQERGIRFSIDVIGDPAATVYFAHGDTIYSLSGNVFGSGESGYGPAITAADFEVVIQGFRFAK